jgi:periplasmic divalent cation tolerance protein
MTEKGYIVVLVTVPEEIAGQSLGRVLVDEGLAACVQVLPGGAAIYRWQGRTHNDPMTQLIIKTREAAWPALQARILSLHSDEVPEILALPVQAGLPAYLSWMDASVTG